MKLESFPVRVLLLRKIFSVNSYPAFGISTFFSKILVRILQHMGGHPCLFPKLPTSGKAVRKLQRRLHLWTLQGRPYGVGVFREVFFREESITAFRFSKKFLADLGDASLFTDETIQLESPFRIREPMPKGHKRCNTCNETKPMEAFYKRRSQCRECFNTKLQQMKRKKKKEQQGLGSATGR